jgi:hypothetical protein
VNAESEEIIGVQPPSREVPMHVLDSAALANDQANARSQTFWSNAIHDSWRQSTQCIIETGRLLLHAQEELDRDVFRAMRLPFGKRTRERLMAIAAHPFLATHVSQLPPSWGTLYELTRLPDQILLAKLEDGTIHPDLERKEATALLNRPKKPQIISKPDLLVAWAVATPEVRRVLFDRIDAAELLKLISDAVRTQLIDLLERHRATTGNSSSLSVNLTRLIKVALSSTHANERENALAGINNKLKANGRDLHDIVIAMASTKSRKRQR